MNYLFDENNNKGKKAIFESWGYTISNAEYLKKEIERQAQIAYQSGDYSLGIRNEYGQRISIVIELKNKETGEIVSFISGWMTYPDGKISLTTPYGGK